MQVTTQAIVISSLKYAEADLIVSCFTKSYGLKSYLLRGILKSRKGKLRTSLFQPLTLLQLEAFHKDKGALERINEAKVMIPYQTLHTDVIKSSLLLFLSEVLKNSIKEEAPNPTLFKYITESMIWLDAHNEVANFHLLFLLKLSLYLGFYPDFSENEKRYFNLMEGNFQSFSAGDYAEEGSVVETLKALDRLSFEELPSWNISKQNRMETLDLLLKYYQIHLQGFRKPKSLPVLQQLFH
ncbi:MAG: DNA repair protein RecO [Flavobacteriaceae bacterium]|mgnify:FL=1|nr:DNA repair protein RecO [Flavobacteriaceae bacterium]|tara:strand:+ start:1539 stop:2258 length:720 start_codon:yes stop_codon:yes gene_type:complete